jgi:hypothetical protein
VTMLGPIARLALLGGSVCCAALTAFIAVRSSRYTPQGAAIVIGTLLAATVVLGYAAFRMRVPTRFRIVRELAMVLVALLVVEFMIAVVAPPTPSRQMERMRAAERIGRPFDARTKSQVVSNLQEQGQDALPGLSRDWPRMGAVRQQLPDGLFPLGHASHAHIVECNEGGEYVFFDSDEFGFNNPRGILASRQVDVALVGESFAVGHCVPPERNLAAVIRQTYPRTVNLGIAGTSTLTMLASFREYVEPVRPPLVLWVINPNTVDSWQELKDPLLARYFERDFKQGLIDRQAEVDRAWRDIAVAVQYEFDRRSLVVIKEAQEERFADILTLPRLRERLRLDAALLRPQPAVDLSLFQRAVRMARETTLGWGGDFIVVIMPLYEDVVVRQMSSSQRHEYLTQVLRDEGIDVIDTAAVFAARHDPASLYTMRINNHPNIEGHQLIGRTIVEELSRRQLPKLSARQ